MKFKEVANLFEKLESTSKRLEKILILRDFQIVNPKETPIISDLISGNFQREINKKNLAISLKTCFSTLSFVSQKNEREIEKLFNKIGDIGNVAANILSENKQTSLSSKHLLLSDIITSFKTITNKSGTNKNKAKKEELSKLFINAKTKEEYKFLARLLIDDLRIGVSEGVLKESCVNSYFPQIIGIHLQCENCNYINLNLKKCLKCNTKINIKSQEEIIKNNFKIIEIGTPKEIIGLDTFIGKRDEDNQIKFMLRVNPETSILANENPREIYNIFLNLFERKYNTINSFTKTIKEIKANLQNVFECNITLGTPIRSMLGTRANTIDKSFEISEKPAFIDFK